MTESRIELAKASCVIALTKHIMNKYNLDIKNAYIKLMHSKLYDLLVDSDTRMYLEPNDYLIQAYAIESELGIDALCSYINS